MLLHRLGLLYVTFTQVYNTEIYSLSICLKLDDKYILLVSMSNTLPNSNSIIHLASAPIKVRAV